MDILSSSHPRKWLSASNRNNRILFYTTIFYLTLVIVLIIIFGIIGLMQREDIDITIDNFYAKYYSDDLNDQKGIEILGIVPKDVIADFDISKAEFAKVYFKNKDGDKIRLKGIITDHSFNVIDDELHKSFFGDKRHPPINIGYEICALKVKIVFPDLKTNMIEPDPEEFGGLPSPVFIKKVKIVVGSSSKLKFWLLKMFSKNPLYKKAGKIID